MKKLTYLALVIGLFIIGCTSVGPIGSERVVERNPSSTPDWAITIPETEDGMHFFRAFKTNALTLEDGLTDARQNAVGQVISFISAAGMEDYNKARVEIGMAESREDVGTVIKDGLRILAKNVARGVKEVSSYYEKVERITSTGVKYYYNIYILVRYPDEEYQKALAETITEQKKAAREMNNQAALQLIEEMEQRFNQ
jgi:multidrug efflux pump subunit AcrB